MSVLIAIQARTGSQRFPRKVLADLNGKPMLAHVYLAACRAVSRMPGADVWLITPAGDSDVIHSAVVEAALRGISGDPNDLLTRLYESATRRDVVCRLTGDCPLLDPALIAQVIRLVYTGVEYASNDTRDSGYPDGLDVEAFTGDLLARAYREATLPSDREHVGPWMQRAVPWVKLMAPQPWRDFDWPKLSVDTPADLERVRLVHAELRGATGLDTLGTAITALRARGVAL